MKFFILLLVFLYIPPTIAEIRPDYTEKGLLFSIGEWFLNLSGHSYSDIEERYVGSVKNCEQLKVLHAKKGELNYTVDNQDQSAYQFSDFERVNGRTINFNVIEVLAAGCRGQVAIDSTEFKASDYNLITKQNTYNVAVDTSYDENQNQLNIREAKYSFKDEKYYFPTVLSLGSRTGFYHNEQNNGLRSFPLVTIDKETEVKFSRSGGTLVRGDYSYKYLVTKNNDKTLRVKIEGDVGEVFSHRKTGTKNKFLMILNCETLEGLEINSIENKRTKDLLKLERAVFEDKK